MSAMTYKGYKARIEYSEEDGGLIGHVLGVQDVIGFHGESVNELRTAFETAVDDYLATCAKIGKSPERPASGKILLRIPPDLHAAALVTAQAHGKSLNQWAAKILADALDSGR